MNNMRITMIITTTCIIVLLVVVHSGCSSQVLMDQKSMVSQSQSCHIKMIQYILTSPPTPLCPLYWKKCNWWCVRETKFILKKYRGFGIMFWTRPSFIGRLRGDAEGDLNEGHLRLCISRDDHQRSTIFSFRLKYDQYCSPVCYQGVVIERFWAKNVNGPPDQLSTYSLVGKKFYSPHPSLRWAKWRFYLLVENPININFTVISQECFSKNRHTRCARWCNMTTILTTILTAYLDNLENISNLCQIFVKSQKNGLLT